MKIGHPKLKAGILNTVIVITLVITCIISAMVFLAYYQRLALLQSNIKRKLTLNAYSGLNYIIANEKLSYEQPLIFDLFGDKVDSVELVKKAWGLYDIAVSSARRGKQKETIIAQIGAFPDRFFRSTLYLADDNQALGISGHTIINGNCLLPKAGIKSFIINSESFLGNQLVNGKILESTAELPAVDAQLYKRLALYSDLKNIVANSFSENLPKKGQKKILCSFLQQPQLIYSPNDLIVRQTSIRGNVLIIAGRQVVIENSALLDNVLVIGANVIVRKGFKGNLQIIARDTIIVEESCQFEYPSVLSCYSRTNTALIDIKENCELGGIIYMGGQTGLPTNTLRIAEKVIIKGQVYVDGMVEHKGTLYGNIICRKFFLITASSFNENVLRNAVLDGNKLPKHFASSQLLSPLGRKTVVKWLP